MNIKSIAAATAIVVAFGLSGCANDGSLALSTGSINAKPEQAAAKRIDPACVALMARIDDLRREGTPGRIAKVATGKTKTAKVKRSALARMTELDTANAQFQQKCSTLASPTPPAAAVKAAAAQPAKTAAAAITPAAVAKPTAAPTAATTATKAAKKAASTPAAAAIKKAAEDKAAAAVKAAAAKTTAAAVAQ
ncbi:MAG: hypothetical protein K0U74_17125 [Alphaproteobacteria bacterium]|nr:hypothetical protein [Alphaproteobacteria bacterium]